MAISDPLDLVDFWEKLAFAGRPEFVPQHYNKQSLDGAGNVLSSRLGSPKWLVQVTAEGGWHDRNLEQEADIVRLESLDKKFLAYDIRRPFPAWDPDGSILGSAAVKVKTKGSNNRSLSLEDLPAHFRVTKSDKLSVLYQSTKRFLCKAEETVSADGLGDTAEFEVWPFLPPGLAVGDTVTLIKPCAHFKIVAGSYRPSAGLGNLSNGFSFSAISVP